MTTDERSGRDLLLTPEGGSLNTIELRDGMVVKRYEGDDPRGYEKLLNERWWLEQVPATVREQFATPLGYSDTVTDGVRVAELRLAEVPESRALAKAILLHEVSPTQAAAVYAAGMRLLRDHVYGTRSAYLPGALTYERHHGRRVARAIDGLRRVPGLREIIESERLTVNGIDCPPIPRIAQDLATLGDRWRDPSRLVAAHGDAHPDNLLISKALPWAVWCDPRGDALLPPHYDAAKALKAARGGYDLIHYGHYALSTVGVGGDVAIHLDVDPMWNDHYGALLDALDDLLPSLADAEELTVAEFRRRVVVAEIAHIISFCRYHAGHPRGCDVQRIRAYLAVAALLGRRLIDGDAESARSWRTPLFGAGA